MKGTRRSTRTLCAIVTALLVSLIPLRFSRSSAQAPAVAEQNSNRQVIGPSVVYDDYHDISAELSELVRLSPKAQAPAHIIPWHRRPGPPMVSRRVDPALQSSANIANPLVGVTNGSNFIGISNISGVWPPDTNAATGTTQIVETVNVSFQVFNRSGGSLLGPSALSSLWSNFGVCGSGPYYTDPVVLYDKAANRWLVTQIASSSSSFSPSTECIAVSTSSDATGSFFRYAYSSPYLADYPKFGVWPDAFYGSYNLYSGNTFVAAQVCAYDRRNMLIGNSASAICFQSSADFGLLPSDLNGSVLHSAGEPNFFVELASASSLNLFRFHADFSTPSNSTFNGPYVISVAPFTEACTSCIGQGGTGQTLDSLGDRLMHRLAYRSLGDHEALVVNHSVAVGNTTGPRWYEIRDPNGTPNVYQQGTYAPDSNCRWMGSIAMDASSDMAAGYSVSSVGMFPAVRYTGRVPTDGLGLMETENSIIEGGGSQLTLSRWGDYSSMAIDPADDCKFVYASEYYSASGTNWNTRIASFNFPSCIPSKQTGYNAFYSSADQHIHQLTLDFSGNTSTFDLSTLSNAPAAAASSRVTSFFDPGNLFGRLSGSYAHIYYLGSDQHVHEIFWISPTGPWWTYDPTAATGNTLAAVGSALTSFVNNNGVHVYYLGGNQHVYELYWNSNTQAWSNGDLTAATGNTLAAAGSALASFSNNNGEHVYYLGANQHVYELYWNSSTARWSNGDLSAVTGNTLAASGTRLTGFSNSNGEHVYYLGGNQHVYELYWNSNTQAWSNGDLTAATGNTLAAAGSALTSFSNTNGEHVYYWGPNQHLYELYWNSSTAKWSNGDISQTVPNAPLGAAGSALATIADGIDQVTEQSVFYLGTNQLVEWFYWNSGSGWSWRSPGTIQAASGSPLDSW